MKRVKYLLIGSCFIGVAIIVFFYLLNLLLLNNEVPRKKSDNYRIGYLNLHENKLSPSELLKLQKWNCDLWLFLEWNGNNLDTSFLSKYSEVYNESDTKTYGTLVIAKKTNFQLVTIDQPAYTCNYKKHILKLPKQEIFLVHVPPPLPTCNYETGQYIEDLLEEAKRFKNPILIGDFNQTYFNEGIKKIQNAGFKMNSSPLIPTLGLGNKLPKMVKVDYVFTRESVEASTVNWFTLPVSDHAGCIVDVKIN